jgi:uncharacterized membrane protein
MEPGIVLVVLVILGIPIALAIWLIVRAVSTNHRIEGLSDRLVALESEIIRLKGKNESPKPAEPTPAPQPKIITPPPVAEAQPTATPQPVVSEQRPTAVPPPPPIPATPTPPPRAKAPVINWEQFMGVKGFAWIGGVALFLGVAFFVKYSFDNNLLPPELRVAIGFLTGLGLLVVGVIMSRRNYAALSQTLCATGVVILYAVTFACRSIYHFEFFGPIPTFLLMALITATAFLLAVRLDALVVAILGMLGGFLTPVLLSTGQDNPLGLFGYVAILDTGLIIVALNRRWFYLPALAAFGTAFMQIGWMGKFFIAEKYFEGNKILITLAVLFGFNVLYLAASWWAKFRKPAGNEEPPNVAIAAIDVKRWLSGSTLGFVAVALMSTAWFLDFEPLAQRPWLLFGFAFLIDLVVVALVLADETITVAQSIAGFAVFGLLGFWTARSLTSELLNAALVYYFIFAIVHSVLPVLLQRRRGSTALKWVNHLFPILALALVLVPVF